MPKATFASAIPWLAAGDTLLVRGGTYRGDATDFSQIPAGTSWDSPTTIAAYPNETVEIVGGIYLAGSDQHYIVFSHLTTRHGGFEVSGGSDHIEVSDGELNGDGVGYANGVSTLNSGGNRILRTKVHGYSHLRGVDVMRG
jgi:hypothetical protein